MRKIAKISSLALLVLALCGAGATAGGFPGGFLSTTTSVSVDGTVNESVSVKYAEAGDGLTEKNEWGYSYVSETPARQSFGTHLSIGASDEGMWWNFQKVGLPDEPVDILTPGTYSPFFKMPSFTHFF